MYIMFEMFSTFRKCPFLELLEAEAKLQKLVWFLRLEQFHTLI